MLKLNQLSLRRGPRILLEDVNIHIKFNQKIGVVGKNGCGKSSFFALLLEDLLPDLGTVEIPSGTTWAHLEQEITATEQQAIEYVLDGDKELRKFQSALIAAEEQHDGIAIADLHEKIRTIDGYSANARAAAILDGLGFSQGQLGHSVQSFSGGWRMRLNLARTLMSRADILLLDEPTNHLDLPALFWLEQWLNKLSGTVILISHDRDFLDSVVDTIAHFENKNIKLYTGNYSDFEKQRVLALALQQTLFEKQQRERAHMQEFVDRFKAKATKARQAQSRVKALEKMALITAAHVDSEFDFQFKEPERNPDPLVRLEACDVGYGVNHSSADLILKKVELTIRPGDRYGVIGPNGAGKSTFIKLLAGMLTPKKGTYESNSHLNIGYFAQHQLDQLMVDASPLQHLQTQDSKVAEATCRKFLGGFGFKDDMALTPITNFSGGEKARLALALLVWKKPNLLLLDEPTNHFDLDMRSALTIAIQAFKGALILISHDRHLIRASTDELLLVHNKQVGKFPGSIDDYPAWLEEIRLQKVKGDSAAEPDKKIKKLSRKEARQAAAQERNQRKLLGNKIKQLENEMSLLENRLKVTEEQLADTAIYEEQSKDRLHTVLAEQAEITKSISEKEKVWLELNSDEI